MFSINRIWRLTVVLLALTAMASGGIFSHHKKKKKDTDQAPAGTAILWRAPKDIRQRDLYWGPGGEAAQPDLSHVTLIKKEKGGYSVKYRVRDASGREWVAKLGKEAKGETAASRLMWATGYYADADYLVPHVQVEGLDKPLENVRFSLRSKEVKRLDGWQWKQNPFVGTRQYQGLKVMMALLNNWDTKDSNNKIAVPKKDDSDKELHYFVSDLGGSFGKVSHIPKFLYFKPDRDNPKAYARARLVDKTTKDGRVEFHFRNKNSHQFKDITVDDVQWINGWLSQLSDQQIADAFRAANYSPEEVRLMTQAVRRRINELNATGNSLAATRRRRH